MPYIDQEELDDLNDEIANLRIKNGHLGNAVGKLRKENASLSQQSQNLNIRLSELNVKYNAQSTEISSMAKEIVEQETTIGVLRRQDVKIADLRKEIEGMNQKHQAKMEKLKTEHNKEKGHLGNTIGELRAKLEKYQQESETDSDSEYNNDDFYYY